MPNRSRSRSSGRRCMRPGPLTNNGYLNFLRDYRKTCCGMTAIETVKEGAKQWWKLSEKEREKYKEMNIKRSRRRSRHGVSQSSKRCMRPGPITNNGYLNFIRVFRQTCCGMTPQETIKRGAQQWRKMSDNEKEKYNRMAKSSRGKRREC